jgi:ribosomal protein S18 acetylase RimI-like enzyme
MSVALWEEFVLAKSYFDRLGLIVGLENDRVVGFAHAGFGSQPDGRDLDTSRGVTTLVMTLPIGERAELENALLAGAEAYLRSRGAKVAYLGGVGTINPFYVGLYGGSELPGVLDSDEPFVALSRRAVESLGYTTVERRTAWTRDLATLRPIVDRIQMQIRRRANVETTQDARPGNWWDACVYGPTDRTHFSLVGRDTGATWAWADFWSMDAFSAAWGVRSLGLSRIEVEGAQRREGLATFLLGEALKQLHHQGVSLVETHTSATDATSIALFQKLGFTAVDHGTIIRKQLA